MFLQKGRDQWFLMTVASKGLCLWSGTERKYHNNQSIENNQDQVYLIQHLGLKNIENYARIRHMSSFTQKSRHWSQRLESSMEMKGKEKEKEVDHEEK